MLVCIIMSTLNKIGQSLHDRNPRFQGDAHSAHGNRVNPEQQMGLNYYAQFFQSGIYPPHIPAMPMPLLPQPMHAVMPQLYNYPAMPAAAYAPRQAQHVMVNMIPLPLPMLPVESSIIPQAPHPVALQMQIPLPPAPIMPEAEPIAAMPPPLLLSNHYIPASAAPVPIAEPAIQMPLYDIGNHRVP